MSRAAEGQGCERGELEGISHERGGWCKANMGGKHLTMKYQC